jgi:hypothetical protein
VYSVAMHERVLPEAPTAFLVRHGAKLDVLAAFEPQSGVVVVKVTFADFVRGAGPTNNAAGPWWIRRSDVDRLQAEVQRKPPYPNERRDLMRRAIRDGTAVSVNWNSFSDFWLLSIAATPLEGLRGPAAGQPVWDGARGAPPAQLGNATARRLPGGITQYFFPKVPAASVRYFGRSPQRSS